MGRKMTALAVAAVCILHGCGNLQAVGDDEMRVEKEDIKIEMESSVKPGECFVCGDHGQSLMPYYAKRDSVGIIHWGDSSVLDSEVRAYDDDGNELFNLGHTNIKHSSFGEEYGSVLVTPNSNRGITNVEIHFGEKDAIDLESLSKRICQGCLDEVVKFYEDSVNFGSEENVATTGFCLVDFTNRKLYTLSDPYRGYYIRDYYVTYDIKTGMDNDRIELMIFYAPERMPPS